MTRRVHLITAAAPLAAQSPAAASSGWSSFPQLEKQAAQDIVGASHRDLAKVREIAAAHPAAVNATIDWGFGDWENALGAAAHTGRREIAEFLLERGARLDIFAAAMLGMTEVVKALVMARPGIESTVGPHGIPLLAHAKAGKATETIAYLETLPGAARGLGVEPLAAERREALTGTYQTDDGRKIEIKLTSPSQLALVYQKETPRWIHHAGGEVFYPAGAAKVRVEFEQKDGRTVKLRVVDGPLSMVANRI